MTTIENLTLVHFRHFFEHLVLCNWDLFRISILGFRICAENFGTFHPKEPTKEYVRNFQQIMQNKPKFN